MVGEAPEVCLAWAWGRGGRVKQRRPSANTHRLPGTSDFLERFPLRYLFEWHKHPGRWILLFPLFRGGSGDREETAGVLQLCSCPLEGKGPRGGLLRMEDGGKANPGPSPQRLRTPPPLGPHCSGLRLPAPSVVTMSQPHKLIRVCGWE